jgi:hypothetical protein
MEVADHIAEPAPRVEGYSLQRVLLRLEQVVLRETDDLRVVAVPDVVGRDRMPARLFYVAVPIEAR